MIQSIQNAKHYVWGANCDAWHLLDSDKLSVIQEQMPKGCSEELHYHQFAQQVFYVLSGSATFEVDAKEYLIAKNESIHIPNKSLHRIMNRSEEDLTFLVVSEPKAHGDRIEIIEYNDDLKEPIKTLNYEWLEKYFRVEKGDERSLNNPKEEIIDKGGFIYYARINDQIVGTASLLRKTDDIFEVGKMGVTESAQGLGIGTLLLEHCLNIAEQKAIAQLILYSNTMLDSAIHMYRKYGFTETELEQGLYERANIKMEKVLIEE